MKLNIKSASTPKVEQSIIGEKGNRPDINKEITISDEIKTKYEESKQKVITNRKFATIGGIGIALTFFGFRNLNDFIKYKNLAPLIMIVVGIIIIAIAGILYKKKMGNDKRNILDIYNEGCIEPIVKQIDESMNISIIPNNLSYFKDFTLKDKKTINKHNKRERDSGATNISFGEIGKPLYGFGEYGAKKGFLHKDSYNFYSDLTLDCLYNNPEGFLLMNGTAKHIRREKTIGKQSEFMEKRNSIRMAQNELTNRGKNQNITDFNGSIIVVKMKHTARNGISLNTTKKGLIAKESSEYKRTKNRIELENQLFNDNFDVLAEDSSQAFFVLSPVVMENLLKLKEKYNDFGIYIYENILIFGVNSKHKLLSMPMSKKGAENMSLENSISELKLLLKMIYDLKDAIDLNFERV